MTVQDEIPTLRSDRPRDDDDLAQRRALFARLLETWQGSGESPAADPRDFAETHLRAALPPGWIANFRIARGARHLPADALQLQHYEWRIFRDGDPADDGFEHYYAYLNGRQQLVLVYGNSDAGVGGPQNFWDSAMAIPLANLGLVLPFVFARMHEFPPNRFGLT